MRKTILLLGIVALIVIIYFGNVHQQPSLPTTTLKPAPSIGHPLPAPAPKEVLALHTVGQVTWHAKDFVGKNVRIQGYMIKREAAYVIFSDEATGNVTSHDLPITGKGIGIFKPKQKYIIEGKLVYQGLEASNHNPYHLELSDPSRM